jgi:hypothetical protein
MDDSLSPCENKPILPLANYALTAPKRPSPSYPEEAIMIDHAKRTCGIDSARENMDIWIGHIFVLLFHASSLFQASRRGHATNRPHICVTSVHVMQMVGAGGAVTERSLCNERCPTFLSKYGVGKSMLGTVRSPPALVLPCSGQH